MTADATPVALALSEWYATFARLRAITSRGTPPTRAEDAERDRLHAATRPAGYAVLAAWEVWRAGQGADPGQLALPIPGDLQPPNLHQRDGEALGYAMRFAAALTAPLAANGHLLWCMGSDTEPCDQDGCKEVREAVWVARELGYLAQEAAKCH